jgi:hypothetical protein
MPALRPRPAGTTPAWPVRQPTHSSPIRHGDDQWLLAVRSTSPPRGLPAFAGARPRRYSVQVTAQERVDAVKTHLRALSEKFAVENLPQNAKRARLVELAFHAGIVSRSCRGRPPPCACGRIMVSP